MRRGRVRRNGSSADAWRSAYKGAHNEQITVVVVSASGTNDSTLFAFSRCVAQAVALESHAPPTADRGAVAAADTADAKAGPLATVADLSASPLRRTAANAWILSPDVWILTSSPIGSASTGGSASTVWSAEAAVLQTPPLLPLAAATDACGDADTAGGSVAAAAMPTSTSCASDAAAAEHPSAGRANDASLAADAAAELSTPTSARETVPIPIAIDAAQLGTPAYEQRLRALASGKIVRLEIRNMRASSPAILSSTLLALSSLATIRLLDLCDNQIDDDGAAVLAAVLARLTALEELNLSANLISDRGANAIACSVAQMPLLRILNLSSNHIRQAGAKEVAAALAIASVLTPPSRLEGLLLGGNEIEGSGIRAVAEYLPSWACLETLDLGASALADASTVTDGDLLFLISNLERVQCVPRLRQLGLRGIRIGAAVASALTALQSKPSRADLQIDIGAPSPKQARVSATAEVVEDAVIASLSVACPSDAMTAPASALPAPEADATPESPRGSEAACAWSSAQPTPGAEAPSALTPTQVRCERGCYLSRIDLSQSTPPCPPSHSLHAGRWNCRAPTRSTCRYHCLRRCQ